MAPGSVVTAAALGLPDEATAVRVLFLTHSVAPPGRPLANVGGMQRVAGDLSRALARQRGVTLRTIALRASSRGMQLGTPGFILRAGWSAARAVRRGDVDVVLFSSMVTASLSLVLRQRLRSAGVSSAVIAHGRDVTLPTRPYPWLVSRVFRSVDLVLPVSRAVAHACGERGAPQARLRIVPNGVDPERLRSRERRDEALATAERLSGLPMAGSSDRFVLLSVGRHVPRKGFAWFAREVMPRLPERACWLIAGEGPQTPLIRTVVRERRLERRVRLLGTVSERDLALLYRSADLMLMPNLALPGELEGFGVVILEAGLCDLPTLSADLEGMRDVVTEGRNGFLVPGGDAGAWVARVARLMDDPTSLATARREARAHTLARFAWPVVAGRYAEALSQLVGRHG